LKKLIMYFASATALALLAAISPAAASPLEARQGGVFVAVGLKYSGPGCTASTLINPDPIFGNGNVCQPLDRFNTGVPIRSYSTSSVSEGCSGEFLVF
jgi:hypothetical protein